MSRIACSSSFSCSPGWVGGTLLRAHQLGDSRSFGTTRSLTLSDAKSPTVPSKTPKNETGVRPSNSKFGTTAKRSSCVLRSPMCWKTETTQPVPGHRTGRSSELPGDSCVPKTLPCGSAPSRAATGGSPPGPPAAPWTAGRTSRKSLMPRSREGPAAGACCPPDFRGRIDEARWAPTAPPLPEGFDDEDVAFIPGGALHSAGARPTSPD
mmetsp:Transcript_93071/g.300818  ORF Transcript_93071/g.300818 Transcript_93071/m.300818 type:complete len:209 (-) Transcript_93071:9-635(-)